MRLTGTGAQFSAGFILLSFPHMLFPIVLIVFGFIYLLKPDIFKQGLWKETDIAQRNMSPANYKTLMRVLGIVFVIAGIIILSLKS